jgi:hypothetical protein
MNPRHLSCSIALFLTVTASPVGAQREVTIDEMNDLMRKMGLPTLPAPFPSPGKTPPQPLFRTDSTKVLEADPARFPSAKRARFALLNQDSISASLQELDLNLFDDANYTVSLRSTDSSDYARTYAGSLKGIPGSHAVFAVRNGILAADILLPGRSHYRIMPSKNGLYSVVEVGVTTEPFCSFRAASAAASGGKERGEQAITSPLSERAGAMAMEGFTATPVIDILVLYSPAARAAVSSDPEVIRTSICLEIAIANEVFANSLINARARLIYMRELNFIEGPMDSDYVGLTNETDTLFTDVPALADGYAADQVFLIGSYGAGAGATGHQLTQTTASKYVQMSVPRVFGGEYILTHELGHNLGCDHDRNNAGPIGRYFDFSYGHRMFFNDGIFGTVMALEQDYRIPYFSNPSLTFTNPFNAAEFLPVGIAQGDPNAADNSSTINFTAPIVAAYKTPTEATLHGARVSSNGQEFEANIEGPANSAVEVQYSADLFCWNTLTHLTLSAQGASSFSDSAFATSAQRYYRLRPYVP